MYSEKLLAELDGWYENYKDIVEPSENKIRSVLHSGGGYSAERLAVLLSPDASPFLEEMAQVALESRRKFFGNAIKLFTPLYISNYCSNGCRYCAFRADNKINRRQLKKDELIQEAEKVAESGIRQILVLTGESKKLTSFEYMRDSISEINKHFSSVSMEVYPMKTEEYAELVKCGLDGLTLYQETYDRDIYDYQHPYGDKSNYEWRVEGPERACIAGVRSVQIGALLGLDDYRRELGAMAIHLNYLSKKYPDVELSLSLPRLRPIIGDELVVEYPVNDREYTQILLAFRIIFPHVGITLSTREDENMRNGLIPLGVTKISAGVSTAVGDLSGEGSDEQFDIADERSLEEMCTWLEKNGFQPVLHDWNSKLTRSD